MANTIKSRKQKVTRIRERVLRAFENRADEGRLMDYSRSDDFSDYAVACRKYKKYSKVYHKIILIEQAS